MELLTRFMGGSVTRKTMVGYQREWKTWVEFVTRKNQGRKSDPYLSCEDDRVKVLMMCHLLAERKAAGKREKAATGITAAIRKHFAVALQSTEWMKAEAITVARRACRRTPQENREYAKSGKGRARLPVWFALMEQIREKLWEGRGFEWEDIDSKMTYIAAMYGFDIAARAGEATSPDGESEQHTILCEDVVIHLTEKIRIEGQWIERVRGGDEATLESIEIDNVNTLEICALTHKVGQINTTKRIARNSEEEAQFLEDLMEFMKHSGAGAKDPLFSRNTKKPNGVMSKKKCRPKMVTEAIKTEVTAQGLPPLLFSFHSLRKGAVTHMKALGVSREETLARGNYSANSAMIDTVYNYNSAGTGPLGAMANKKGREPSREDVSRTIRLNYSG
jgi:hypothetical protein